MNNNLIPAATVLVLRDSDDGMEVLMVKRSKRPPFENLYVFPGGKIDKEDHFDDYQKYCKELLKITKKPISFEVFADDEKNMMIGILLAKKQSGEFLDLDGVDKERFDSYRDKLIKNEINLLDICSKEDLMLSTNNIAPLSHWITPNIEAKRFDTRFFIAYLPKNQTVQHDGQELTQSLWINPAAAIEKAFSGELQMIMPTIC